ncbi:MAG TPA: hypothetical protein VH640_18310 [Bryobacteraceae bacterium]
MISCSIYDALQKRWDAAAHEDTRARDPGAQRARQMSSHALAEWRARAFRELLAVERERNSHIEHCPSCLAEGRPKLNSSQVRD